MGWVVSVITIATSFTQLQHSPIAFQSLMSFLSHQSLWLDCFRHRSEGKKPHIIPTLLMHKGPSANLRDVCLHYSDISIENAPQEASSHCPGKVLTEAKEELG